MTTLLLQNYSNQYETLGCQWNSDSMIYLWSKVVCLFCFVLFVLMRSTKLGCFRLRSWSLWKALEEEGWYGLVSWRLDLRCRSSWILNNFFTENYIYITLWSVWIWWIRWIWWLWHFFFQKNPVYELVALDFFGCTIKFTLFYTSV
jgi:hypothetical protein